VPVDHGAKRSLRRTAVVGWRAAGLLVLTAASGVLLATCRAPEAAAATTQVKIANYQYSPNPLNVHVGDTVTWTNEDDAPHTVTSTSGPTKLDSPQLSKGQSWTYTFPTAGTYMYYCTVHPDMKAEVVVAMAPLAQAPAAAPAASTAPGATHPAQPGVATTTTRPGSPTTSPPQGTAAPAAVPATSAASPPPTLVTTTTSTSPGALRINPLLFLLAVVAAVVTATALGIHRSPSRAKGSEADSPSRDS